MATYATEAALTLYLGDDQTVPATWDVDRVLAAASRVVDRLVTARWAAVPATGLPSVTATATALSAATCATVEYWMAAGGEDVDVVKLVGPISFDGISMGGSTSWVPPRAEELLRQAGLRGEPGQS